MSQTRRISAVALALALMTLNGCAMISPSSGYCVPRVHVEPTSVRAGDTVTVVSEDRCEVTVPTGGWLVVAGHVGDGGNGPVQVRSSEPFDGSFRVDLQLPKDFPAGEAYAGVINWDYSTCPDTASCAGPLGGFTVER